MKIILAVIVGVTIGSVLGPLMIRFVNHLQRAQPTWWRTYTAMQRKIAGDDNEEGR